MIADRRVRDAAKAVLDADLSNLKSNLSQKGVGARAADRVKHGARDVYDEAAEITSEHTGVVAAILAAVVLWFARNPILDALFGDEDEESDHEDDERCDHFSEE
ncbi:hypothetical protein [Qipengyuania spongiae]|uniref:DUF3618 domain-containing protein n=1 Tax=Qipengyuania spongiae TaxID=2909673 RepID=A0ABY5SXA6_9SPHN|nr:hypothetical protein [Qipengyuania spongiae]UVI38795.1 hypothetical protein L1F33_11145 [Qipengyuania spongiae]